MPQDRQHLVPRDGIWYVRIIVPPSVREKIGSEHLRRSLRTRSLAEANRRKHAVIAEFKQQIEIARHGASWKVWREELRGSTSKEHTLATEFLIIDEAEEIAERSGEEEARRFYKRATTTEPVLSELVSDFLDLKDHGKDGLRKHQTALKELVAHFRDDDVPPRAIDARKLLAFTDKLLASSLAPNTKRDRLGGLGKFWDWLERRLHADRGSNPFRGHTIKGGTVDDGRAYTDAEVKQLLGSKFTNDWQRQVFTMLLLTGARPNEICGLRHCDIDLEARTFSIRASKTDAGVRTLPYRHKALETIFSAIRSSDESCASERVFPLAGPDEKPAKNFINYFSRHLDRLKMPEGVKLYSTRKTFVGKSLDLRADVINLERYIGHKNQRLALSTYTKGRSDEGLIVVAELIAQGWNLGDALPQ
jgi:integrase